MTDPSNGQSDDSIARELDNLLHDNGNPFNIVPDPTNVGPVLPKPLSWDDLRQPVDFKDTLLGDRFMERGQGVILYGPSGCGKSVAGDQAVAEWAAGLDGLHIKPAFPLRIVVIQTEDSLNDRRENMAGILSSTIFTPEKLDLVEKNLIMLPAVPGGSSGDLSKLLTAAALEYKPDLIYTNPLLAFCPGDPSRELGGLLYQTIDPIIKRHNVGFLGNHHTPKTNNRDTSAYGSHDFQYLAAGDARVANWPRGMIQIEPVANGIYRFRIAKRWQRSGWTWDGNPTNERYFRHSPTAIRWLDATPEEAAQTLITQDYARILEVLPEHHEQPISRERLHVLAKNHLNIGKNRADDWLSLVQEDGLACRIEHPTSNNRKEALFRKGKNGSL